MPLEPRQLLSDAPTKAQALLRVVLERCVAQAGQPIAAQEPIEPPPHYAVKQRCAADQLPQPRIERDRYLGGGAVCLAMVEDKGVGLLRVHC